MKRNRSIQTEYQWEISHLLLTTVDHPDRSSVENPRDNCTTEQQDLGEGQQQNYFTQ